MNAGVSIASWNIGDENQHFFGKRKYEHIEYSTKKVPLRLFMNSITAAFPGYQLDANKNGWKVNDL